MTLIRPLAYRMQGNVAPTHQCRSMSEDDPNARAWVMSEDPKTSIGNAP